MTASEKPHRSLWRRAEGEPVAGADEAPEPWPEHTVPRFPPRQAEDDGPSLLGFHAEFVHDTTGAAAPADPVVAVVAARTADRLVFSRRAEWLGGVLLVLAGIAAAGSLLPHWTKGDDATGSSLVSRGLAVLGGGVGALLRSTLWQPLAVVFAGYALLLLGLLLFVPARTHRALGVLALLVAAPAVAGVVVPLADAGWSSARFGPGMWLAAAVGCLGLLGALRAMLTGPRIALRGPARGTAGEGAG